EDGIAKLVDFAAAVRAQPGGAGIEQHLRLEHETVADHPDVRPRAKNAAQAAEELRPVTRQLLYPLGERHVQALAELGDAALSLLVALLGRIERLFQRRELAAQGRDLLVQ